MAMVSLQSSVESRRSATCSCVLFMLCWLSPSFTLCWSLWASHQLIVYSLIHHLNKLYVAWNRCSQGASRSVLSHCQMKTHWSRLFKVDSLIHLNFHSQPSISLEKWNKGVYVSHINLISNDQRQLTALQMSLIILIRLIWKDCSWCKYNYCS